MDIHSYDTYILAFSAGKDCSAAYLHLRDWGIDPTQIELWHHEIDGKTSDLMDWPCTPSYCRAFARAFGSPIYFSWRQGGFENEMLRQDERTAPVFWENPDGTIGQAGGVDGPLGTRMKFPQASGDLSVRWCSAALKIDVMSMAIRNQPRFDGKRTLVISGERAQESACRSKYKVEESHRTNVKKRHVDHWRPIHKWDETEVWEIIKRYNVRVHPAYYLGWGRVSCIRCIFGSANQWASGRSLQPEQFNRVAAYEQQFGCTIRRKESVIELADRGTPYQMAPEHVKTGLSTDYDLPIIMQPGEWTLPAGAYGESAGPT